MQTKQPAHKLVFLLLCGLFYLPGCMNSHPNGKDDKKDDGVKVHLSLPPDKSGKARWETTFVRKFSDTAAYMIVMPMQVRSSMSDSIGGSSPDTLSLQLFRARKGDFKTTPDDDDDDDK